MSNGAPRLTAQDIKWRAEEDVRTLVRSAEITGDAKRFALATKESNKQQAALEAVAKQKKAAPKKATKKSVRAKRRKR